ncbi:MAG: DUF5674 family protein [Blastocatellia bacterium]
MIHLLRSSATPQQLDEMAETGEDFIKVAVDIRLEILAGGGDKHADCEKVLLDNGSQQEDVWGATWWTGTKYIRHESLINIRPRQKNFSMVIGDQTICDRVTKVIRRLLEGI